MKLCKAAIAFLLYDAVYCSGVSYTLDTHKRPRHKTGTIQQDYQKPNLFWGSVYTVGARKDVALELDTGSDNLILNKGVYEPSPHGHVRPNDHFAIHFEGANKAGRGVEFISGNIIQDVVSDGVLTIQNQTFGNATHFRYQGVPEEKKATTGYDGIIGWMGARQSNFKPPPGSWFFNLCKQGLIAQCRFGLALGTKHKGKQVVGKVDKSLIKGDLTYAKHRGVWVANADVTLNNKIFIKNQIIAMDVGTTNMQAPSNVARQIFDKLHFPYTRSASGPGYNAGQKHLWFVDATYPCDKPPLLGFSIPSQDDLKKNSDPHMSKKARIFNMLRSEWEFKNNGNNNCTAILAGDNAFGSKVWLIGQPFFQGHYIDMQIGRGIGFGDLKNIETGGPE